MMQKYDDFDDKLAIGRSDFHILREDQDLYVDKTEALYELVKKRSFCFFFRPRRFGKTLLVSTIKSLFKDGLKDFKGLAIEKKWADTTYPVIHLDFTDCRHFQTVEEFDNEFSHMLVRACKRAGLTLPRVGERGASTIANAFNMMLSHLDESTSLVLLIDESDSPLNGCLFNKELFDDVQRKLSAFYYCLKRYSYRFRFLFITGICHYLNEDIFSGLNFMSDVSLDSDCSTLVGFTQEELRKYFKVHIERASAVLGLTFEEVIDKMTLHYGGYCFDETASNHVLSTWSVLNFLRNPEDGFENYWIESGGHSIELLKYMTDDLKAPSEYGQNQCILANEVGVVSPLDYRSSLSVLLQAGYLTIHDVEKGINALTLNYPNIEVSRSMSFLYSEELFHNNETAWISISPLRLFSKKDVDDIVKHINVLLGSIDYTQYPIKDEASLRCIMQVYLISGGITGVDIEKHNAFGRSDLEFKAGNKYYVIELKYAKEKDDAQKLLETAKAQIKDKHYGESSYPELKHINLALVFSGKDRQFCAWESF